MKYLSATLIIVGLFISMSDSQSWDLFAWAHLIGALMMAGGGLIALAIFGRGGQSGKNNDTAQVAKLVSKIIWEALWPHPCH